MSLLLSAVLALQGAGPGVSDEMLFFNYLREARFGELSSWMDKLPPGHSLEAARPWVNRLSSAQQALIEAVNRGGIECDLKEVYPDSPKSGKIIGATATTLSVQDGERKRSLIWSGLPPRVTFLLARRYLTTEAEKDRTLLPELADALGLDGELRGSGDGWAGDVEAVEAVRKALGDRSLPEAQQVLGPRLEGKSVSPSLKVAALWVRRLEQAGAALAVRKGAAAGRLPVGSVLTLYEDFEGGPELFPKSWIKGSISARPDGSDPRDRWCLKSTFTGVREAFSELVAHLDFGVPEDARPLLEEWTYLSCRIWAFNTRTVSVVMEASNGDQSDRVSRIDTAVRPEQWTRIRVRLGDVTLHRPRVAYYSVVQPVALGDRMHVLRFEANRENTDRKDGYFYVDDLQVYVVKPPDAGLPDKR
ncbi:MAG TPA: hypothetical protein VKW04_22110 [Planctomycetota bacterium]|nr:hypothetical protein [Planctomycetota bacterium]